MHSIIAHSDPFTLPSSLSVTYKLQQKMLSAAEELLCYIHNASFHHAWCWTSTLNITCFFRKTTISQKILMLAMTATVTWWGHTVVPVTQWLASVIAGQGSLAAVVTSVPMPLLRSPLWAVKVSCWNLESALHIWSQYIFIMGLLGLDSIYVSDSSFLLETPYKGVSI